MHGSFSLLSLFLLLLLILFLVFVLLNLLFLSWWGYPLLPYRSLSAVITTSPSVTFSCRYFRHEEFLILPSSRWCIFSSSSVFLLSLPHPMHTGMFLLWFLVLSSLFLLRILQCVLSSWRMLLLSMRMHLSKISSLCLFILHGVISGLSFCLFLLRHSLTFWVSHLQVSVFSLLFLSVSLHSLGYTTDLKSITQFK